MSTAETRTAAIPRREPFLARAGRFLDHYALYAYTVFAIMYLLLPVAVMALFSFNDPPGKSNVAWHGFTLDAWLRPFAVPGLFDVVRTSVVIAFLSTIIATALGTLIALALVRYNFRGSGSTNTLIFLPLGDAGDRAGRLAADAVRGDRRSRRSSRRTS